MASAPKIGSAGIQPTPQQPIGSRPLLRRRRPGGSNLVRLLSFFSKEVNEIRRQIRLVLSLVLGPFLILLLFGAGYQGDQPTLRTALVIPDGSLTVEQQERIKQAVQTNFPLVYVGPSEEEATRLLEAGQATVVQVLPSDIEGQVRQGQQAQVQFRYNEINPLNEQWIQYLSYAQVIELNRAILLDTTRSGQQQAGELRDFLSNTKQELTTLRQGLGQVQQANSRDRLQELSAATAAAAASPVLAAQAQFNPDAARARDDLLRLQEDLRVLQEAVDNDRLQGEQQRLDDTITRVESLEGQVASIQAIPPEVIVSPLREAHTNKAQIQLNFMQFYAPAVMALIIQHIAVTLGALSLVRERLQGSIELFRVAPVSATQLLSGKYVGFTLFIALIGAVLTGLMLYLDVPLLGNPIMLALVLLLVALASLGVGFLISSISTSDSQAVQLSMLVLLMSVFFSGFFLPLENFWGPVRYVGLALPLTHGIVGLQDVMLRGQAPGVETLGWLIGIALTLFVVVSLLLWREFRRG